MAHTPNDSEANWSKKMISCVNVVKKFKIPLSRKVDQYSLVNNQNQWPCLVHIWLCFSVHLPETASEPSHEKATRGTWRIASGSERWQATSPNVRPQSCSSIQNLFVPAKIRLTMSINVSSLPFLVLLLARIHRAFPQVFQLSNRTITHLACRSQTGHKTTLL